MRGDAADEHLLHHLSTEGLPATGCRTLILNDAWGALSTVLANAAPWTLSDSFLSHKGTEVNLRNGRASAAVRLLSSLDRPDDSIDLLLFKVPKSLALLEDELYRLRPLARADAYRGRRHGPRRARVNARSVQAPNRPNAHFAGAKESTPHL